MEGTLRAWEALQRTLEMVAENPDLLEVWARVKRQEINPD
jgi:hypothetical protein